MDRINHSTATSERMFTEGSAAAAIPATVVSAKFLNDVQEEMCNVVLSAGLQLDPADDTQLRQAVARLLAAAVAAHDGSDTAHEDIRALLAGIVIPNATEAVAGIIRLATQAQVLAGSGGGAVTPETLLAGLLGAGGGAGFDYVSIPYRDRTTGARKNLVIQWGVNQAIASTGTFVTLPIAYPNGVMRHFSASTTGPGVNGSPVTFGITGYSATGATVFCYINGIAQASACNWFSIGF